jgi:hypothetical protein
MNRTAIIALAIAAGAFASHARAAEPGTDLHIAAGAVIASGTTLITGRPLLGFAAGCFADWAKEEYDRHNPPHVATGKDIMATCLGAAAGAGAAWVVLPRRDGVAVGYRLTFN